MAARRDTSQSGDPILRHTPRDRPFSVATGDPRTVEKIGDHVQRFAGSFDVLHEVISDLVHLDVFHAAPSGERSYHTLVTCGMSDRPMAALWRLRALRYAELMLCLPADWPLSWEKLDDECGFETLQELLGGAGVSELLRPDRASVVA